MSYRNTLDALRHRLDLIEAERDTLARRLAAVRGEADQVRERERHVEQLEARIGELSGLPRLLEEREREIRALEEHIEELAKSLPQQVEASVIEARRLRARNRELSEALAQERALQRGPDERAAALQRTVFAIFFAVLGIAFGGWLLAHV